MLCLNGNEIIFIIVTLKSIHYCYCVFENNDSKYVYYLYNVYVAI